MRFLTLLILALFSLPLHGHSQAAEETPENYEWVWVVVADTGTDYASLHHQMLKLSRKAHLSVDLLGRDWNAEKQKITLPADSDDDIWAGEYYPRRVGDPFLSLEQFDWYTEQSTPQTLALLAGFSTEKPEADKLLRRIKRYAPHSHLVKHHLYIGCMH